MQLRRSKSAGCEAAATARRGAALAEMAILLPFVALMFVAAVDFCRVYYCAQTVASCARSGAMYASGSAQCSTGTSPTDAATQAALLEGVSLDPPLQAQDVAVSFDSTSVTVTVTYSFQTITSFPGLGGPYMVQRSVTMVLAPKAPGQQ
jgi:Flp pilus assembly protein TadG